MEIITNNQPRNVLYWYELTDAERGELDYIEEQEKQESFQGFRYKGCVYDLGEFVAILSRDQQAKAQNSFAHTCENDDPLLNWQGISSESYFSGVVVKYINNYESVIVGRYFS